MCTLGPRGTTTVEQVVQWLLYTLVQSRPPRWITYATSLLICIFIYIYMYIYIYMFIYTLTKTCIQSECVARTTESSCACGVKRRSTGVGGGR